MNQAEPNELLESLRAELVRDKRVDPDRARIELEPCDSGLCLDGEVPDIASKRITANILRQLAGEVSVTDRLSVAAEGTGDRQLEQQIVERLAAEPVFREHELVLRTAGRTRPLQQPAERSHRLEIEVSDGVVGLDGSVGSRTHLRLAEALCWWTAGCRRVDNRLEVRPAQEDSDNLITDAVRIVLEKDPLVDATQLRAATAAGIVELRGLLANERLRDLVLRDTWAVPGVWDIYDRIEVGEGPA